MTVTIPPPRGRAPVRIGRLALVLALSPFVLIAPEFLRIGLIEAFESEGPSMEPTLMSGDLFAVDKRAFGLRVPEANEALWSWGAPQLADVVVLTSPSGGESIVKRVVGLPGDTLEWRDGDLLRNGHSLRKGPVPCPSHLRRAQVNSDDLVCFGEELGGRSYVVTQARDSHPVSRPPLRVPAGHGYVLGDHRDRSNDSRAFGPAPFSQFLGRATFVYWSPTAAARSIQ